MYDILIIGSGPGGYVAAVRAAQLGLKTAIVEREHLGGICLNWGCIPTKALLRSADMFQSTNHLGDFGISLAGSISVDIAKVVARSRSVSARLNAGVGFLMKKNKVDVIWGEAMIELAPEDGGPGVVKVTPSTKPPMQPQNPIPKYVKGPGAYKTRNIVVATGARPRVLPGVEPDGDRIWTYFDALIPKQTPKSIMVLGSGAIGIEFASFYRAMGSDVTVIEMMSRILPAEDIEVSTFAKKQMERRGISFLLDAKISDVGTSNSGVSARVGAKDGSIRTINADCLISAVGVACNSEGLGLEEAGVKIDRGIVSVDDFGRTNVPGIFAIGDVAGPPMLAHKAEHEGVICVESIAGLPGIHPLERSKIPACTYADPQIASVGLTEEKAKSEGFDIRVGRFPFAANGKALALGEDQGFIKTVFDRKSGKLLGAHMVGPEVTELIQGFVIAMNLETTEDDLMHTIFPHPTLSEGMKESVLAAYDQALNF